MTSDSTGARGAAASGAPIKLRDAPALRFADDFARLAALKGGEAEALEALDRPAAGRLTLCEFAYAAVTVREAAADEPAPPAAEDDPAAASAPSSRTAGAGGATSSRRRSAKPRAKSSGRGSRSGASTPPMRPSTGAGAGGRTNRQSNSSEGSGRYAASCDLKGRTGPHRRNTTPILPVGHSLR
jgi:hypothetical protein